MRIFEKSGIKVAGNILPYNEVRIFSDLESNEPNEKTKAEIIRRAERLSGKEYPHLKATDFLRFAREGNRAIFEEMYFMRRNDLLCLLCGELYEQKGRFSDDILNLVWMISEESSWVIPAHTLTKPPCQLPYNWGEEQDNIDLFSACTAGSLAWVYYYAEKVFPEESLNTVKARLEYELNRRIFKPFTECNILSWMAYTMPGHLKRMNNWNPWISSNILTIIMLCEKDDQKREQYTGRILEILDNYLDGYAPDGGCDEGTTYWGAAAGALLDCLEILYDLSGGKINIYDNPTIKAMGEYILNFHISGNYYVTFADSHATMTGEPLLLMRYGKHIGSKGMFNLGFSYYSENMPLSFDNFHPYRSLKSLCPFDTSTGDANEINGAENLFVPSISTMIQRNEKFFLAAKGGHNSESHSHNDVGNFIVYADGEPLIIDAGVGTYSRDTFGANRYKIWSMQSSYHNLPEFNGVMQPFGAMFRAENEEYNEAERSFKMELCNAYPNEAGLSEYYREIKFVETGVDVTDRYSLKEKGQAVFNIMTADLPTLRKAGEIALRDGHYLKYNQNFSAEIEEIIFTDEMFKRDWKRDRIYRIKLSSPKTASEIFKLEIR